MMLLNHFPFDITDFVMGYTMFTKAVLRYGIIDRKVAPALETQSQTQIYLVNVNDGMQMTLLGCTFSSRKVSI